MSPKARTYAETITITDDAELVEPRDVQSWLVKLREGGVSSAEVKLRNTDWKYDLAIDPGAPISISAGQDGGHFEELYAGLISAPQSTGPHGRMGLKVMATTEAEAAATEPAHREIPEGTVRGAIEQAAGAEGLAVDWDPELGDTPIEARNVPVLQTESALNFADGHARAIGARTKVVGKTLVVRKAAERFRLQLDPEDCGAWTISLIPREAPVSAEISTYDQSRDEEVVVPVLFEEAGVSADHMRGVQGKPLQMSGGASLAGAESRAAAELKRHLEDSQQITIPTRGDPRSVPGTEVELTSKWCKKYVGIYRVIQATHSRPPGGDYDMSLTVVRDLGGSSG